MAAEEVDGLAISRPHYGCEYRGSQARVREAAGPPSNILPGDAQPGLRSPCFPGDRCRERRLRRRRRGESVGSRFWCWPAGPTGGVPGPLGAARRASHGAGAEGLAAVSSPGATERWEKLLGARRWGGLLPSGSGGVPAPSAGEPRASPKMSAAGRGARQGGGASGGTGRDRARRRRSLGREGARRAAAVADPSVCLPVRFGEGA